MIDCKLYSFGKYLYLDLKHILFSGWQHGEIYLKMRGDATLTVPTLPRSRQTPSSPCSLFLIRKKQLLKPAGKLEKGTHRIPFSLPLIGMDGSRLLETYNGTHVNILYMLTININRGIFQPRSLEQKLEFVVHHPKQFLCAASSPDDKSTEHMDIDANNTNAPTTAQHSSSKTLQIKPSEKSSIDPTIASFLNSPVPDYLISCVLHRVIPKCALHSPLTGLIMVEKSDTPLSCIEIQLVRVESISKEILDFRGSFLRFPHSASVMRSTFKSTNVMRKSKSEIVRLEIVDGDVCRNIPIPIYMPFPRLKTCATFVSEYFSIEFELNVIVSFQTGYVVTETYPVVFFRG